MYEQSDRAETPSTAKNLKPTYTLGDARRILAEEAVRQSCSFDGHHPVRFSYTDLTGWCECGQYQWKGEKAPSA